MMPHFPVLSGAETSLVSRVFQKFSLGGSMSGRLPEVPGPGSTREFVTPCRHSFAAQPTATASREASQQAGERLALPFPRGGVAQSAHLDNHPGKHGNPVGQGHGFQASWQLRQMPRSSMVVFFNANRASPASNLSLLARALSVISFTCPHLSQIMKAMVS